MSPLVHLVVTCVLCALPQAASSPLSCYRYGPKALAFMDLVATTSREGKLVDNKWKNLPGWPEQTEIGYCRFEAERVRIHLSEHHHVHVLEYNCPRSKPDDCYQLQEEAEFMPGRKINAGCVFVNPSYQHSVYVD